MPCIAAALLAARGCARLPAAPRAPPRRAGAPRSRRLETEPVELTIFWWGGDARAKLTQEALALYTQKHPNVTFKKTWQANQGYFDKLATLTAGGNAPDIFQIDDNCLAEYAARNITLDLTTYQSRGKLDTSQVPREPVASTAWSTASWPASPLGENTQGLVYNKTLLAADSRPRRPTGRRLGGAAHRLGRATSPRRPTARSPARMDPSADYKAFWVWLRQQGKDLYNGKELGFTARGPDHVVRAVEGRPGPQGRPRPADVIHEGNASDVTKQLVVTGKAATSFCGPTRCPS